MFYLRNGYQNSNLIIEDYGNFYEMLINGTNVTKEEYYALIKKYTGAILFVLIKPIVTTYKGKDKIFN